jgi:amidase
MRRLIRAGLSALLLTAVVATPAAQADRTSGFKLEEATIDDIQEAFDGELTCVKLTKMYLARIAAYEDGGIKLNSITTVNPLALTDAAALDRERRRHGPRSELHCIPVLLKDNVDTFDMPTSNGSVILKRSVPPDDAFIAAKLRGEGALMLGKAAMGEFAGGSYNTIDGQIVNPYNLKRQTGGSSAGSGAALAANIGVLAIGTDTSTSVRGPASFTGIVGLRPTTGLISRDGIAPKNLNFDSAGPMARTVTDAAEMLSVVAAPDGGADPLNAEVWGKLPPQLRKRVNRRSGTIDYTKFLKKGSLKGVRLGAVRDFFGGDPEIDALAEQALDVMRARGATIVDINLDPAFLQFYVVNGGSNIRRIADYRFKADWEAYLATLSPDVPKTVADFIRIYETEVNQSPLPVEASVLNLLKRSLTTSVDDPRYANLIDNLLPAATAYKLSLFDDHDLDALVFPYQTSFASPISNPVFSIPDPAFVNSTRPQPSIFAGYSSIGFPGIVVPMGFGSQGLPMTISLMGKPYGEGDLLGMAYDYEQASKRRAPSPLTPPLAGEVPTDSGD